MNQLSKETERQAKENLEKAFQDILRRHFTISSSCNMELNYGGCHSIRGLIDRNLKELDDLIFYINREERACDDYLRKYCPNFYKETSSTRVSAWLNDRNAQRKKEEKKARERIKQAVKNIDEYAGKKSRALLNSLAGGLKRRITDFPKYGIGRPWGTEIRQRLAVATGLKTEVNNLWELGLNSVANSKRVYLGKHFVDLIKKDPAMKKVREAVDEKVIEDIRRRVFRVPFLMAQKIDSRKISGSKGVKLGGKRNDDDMMRQLSFTLQNPVDSFSKYSETWNVGFNTLTWTIRTGTVCFNGCYHAVYNVYGFAYLWEMEFSIDDTLDLRPHSAKKIDFDGAYNIVTSILGPVYHDILGNTDKMKVYVYWKEMGYGEEKIHKW